MLLVALALGGAATAQPTAEIDLLLSQLSDHEKSWSAAARLQKHGAAAMPPRSIVTKRVGELAEEEGHHPALLTEWGRTTVTWWTHKIRGLHRNDFIMAAKTDELYQR